MSQHIGELELEAKEILDLEARKNLLEYKQYERKSAMFDLIRRIFDEGFLPVAQETGYQFFVDDKYGERMLEWQSLLNERKIELIKHKDSFYDYAQTKNFYWPLWFIKDRKILSGHFIIAGETPKVELKINFEYRHSTDNFFRYSFRGLFGFKDLYEAVGNLTDSAIQEFRKKREFFGTKMLKGENILRELKNYLSEYAKISDGFFEKLVV